MKINEQTNSIMNYDIITEPEIINPTQNKSISEKYSELYDISLSAQKDPNKSAVGFFEKLYLSHHLSSLYGVYESSSNS